MSQLTTSPAVFEIETRLGELSSQFRVRAVARGAIVCAAVVSAVTVAVALGAHLAGAGTLARTLAGVWGAVVSGAVGWFIVRPMLRKADAVSTARRIEARVPGLHDGLTNGVLLSRRDDVQSNPWLPHVLGEIITTLRATSLAPATHWGVLKPVVWRSGAVVLASVLVAFLFHNALTHGLRQMFSPMTFVPKVGLIEIVEITPADGTTVVRGQPMEIAMLARVPSEDVPMARLIIEQDQTPLQTVDVAPVTAGDGVRYVYRVDHVDQNLRFRMEVGSTQSAWAGVKVVSQIKLTKFSVSTTPPPYTGRAASIVTPKLTDLAVTRFEAPQGSRVEVGATVDVPAGGAMLQVGEKPPVPMKSTDSGTTFTGAFDAQIDTTIAVLLTDGSGQIIARLPEIAPKIHVTPDAPPAIDMRWPTQDVSVSTTQPIELKAVLRDDWGVTSARVLLGTKADEPLAVGSDLTFAPVNSAQELTVPLNLPADLRQHGRSVRVQLKSTDNRDLTRLLGIDGGPQTSTSPVFEIRFRDDKQLAVEQKEQTDKLRQILMDLLKTQRDLQAKTLLFKLAVPESMLTVKLGQSDLRTSMQTTADTFPFDAQTRVIGKTLAVLGAGTAREAVELSTSILTEPAEKERGKLALDLQSRQRRIISTLESLLAMLNAGKDPIAAASTRPGGDLVDKPAELSKLNEALKEYMKEQKRILDQTTNLAKKPVDNFDDADKKKLEELAMSQEKLDAFMLAKVRDLSAQAEQDMSNTALLKELLEVYSEVTMAKDALKKGATEIAVSLEEMGLEGAKELSTNIEKWLVDTPDRIKWTQEDPLTKTDTPMAELPKELEDMIGELMEQQEDIMEEAEDTAANWTDSIDKGAGWDAADGPIASMSAKGVTGNQLPNNNDMGGRSGEGRSGRSQGEFVEDTATGKGGRNTPTRLDPTPFQKGQITDTSKDPVGGATGGGKMSGQGGAGLEGPVPPAMKEQMQRLAQKQAELRNAAERLNLQYKLGKYDNFKMLESIALMRRVESDLGANRYQNLMYRKDVLLDALSESRTLVGGQISVKYDTTPQAQTKLHDDIHDAMQGDLPAAWSGALNEYYKKLSR